MAKITRPGALALQKICEAELQQFTGELQQMADISRQDDFGQQHRRYRDFCGAAGFMARGGFSPNT
jgi:hypothetical protein